MVIANIRRAHPDGSLGSRKALHSSRISLSTCYLPKYSCSVAQVLSPFSFYLKDGPPGRLLLALAVCPKAICNRPPDCPDTQEIPRADAARHATQEMNVGPDDQVSFKGSAVRMIF